MANLESATTIAERMNPTFNYGTVKARASEVLRSIELIKGTGNSSIKDRKMFHDASVKKINGLAKEMERLHTSGEASLGAAMAALSTATAPRHSDWSMTALLAGRSKADVMDMAFKSQAMARLVMGEAGTAIGIDGKVQSELASKAAPEQFAAVEEAKSYVGSLDRLINPLSELKREVDNLKPTDEQMAVYDSLNSAHDTI